MPWNLHHRRAGPARGGPLGEQEVDVGGIRVLARPWHGHGQCVHGCARVCRVAATRVARAAAFPPSLAVGLIGYRPVPGGDSLAVADVACHELGPTGGDRSGGSLSVLQPSLVRWPRPQDEHGILGDRVVAHLRRIGHRFPVGHLHPQLLAGSDDLAQELRGHLVGLRRRPHAGGQQEPAPGAGDRDIGQPAFLRELSLTFGRLEILDPAGQVLRVRRTGIAQGRQSVPVPAQRVGNPRQAHQPSARRRVLDRPPFAVMFGHRRVLSGREGALHQTGHDDDVPLQTLGGMDGEDLHGLGRRLHGGPFEPALLGDRGVEPGEEPDEGRAVG